MKIQVFLFLFITNTAISQTKTFSLYGKTHLNVIYSTLNIYAKINDSISKSAYGIYGDSLIQQGSITIKSVDGGSSQFSTLDISQLDTDFNLITELKDKIYYVDRNSARDYYYLKNDSIWVHKTFAKRLVWELIKEEYNPFYKIDFGNKHFIYWANSSGLIFKKGGEIKTNFREFEYYYNDTNTHFSTIKKDLADMNFGYFEYKDYKIQLKNYDNIFKMDTSYQFGDKYKMIYPRQDNDYINKEWVYNISKNEKIVLNNIKLKYLNQNSLVAFDNSAIYFYNSKMNLDSQFKYRTMTQDWTNLEYLVGNEIKKISLNAYSLAIPDNRRYVCGTVTHYKMRIIEKDIIITVDGEITNEESFTKKLIIQSQIKFDSMNFINGTKEMNWSDNGGFNNQIVLFKNGKCGLYNFEQKDSIITFKEVLAQEFDKILTVNNFVIVRKNNKEDILEPYLKNSKLRFKEIYTKNSLFLRYKKNNNSTGWISPNGNLFDDVDKR